MLNLEGASNYRFSSNSSPIDKMERNFSRRVTFCSYWLKTATNLKNKIGLGLVIHFEGTLCYTEYETWFILNILGENR